MRRLSLLLALCPTAVLADAPRVVTDIAPVHSLVAQVMGEVGTPQNLIDPQFSPHDANLKPSQARMVQEADLVIMIGDELTPWLSDRARALAPDAVFLPLLEHSSQLLGGSDEDEEDEHHDDHEGHDDTHHAEDADDHAAHDDHADHDKEDHADHDEDHKHDEEHAHEDEHGHDDDGHKEEDGHEEHAGHEDAAHEDEGGHEGHNHGHGTDPHAWLSPENAAGWLDEIAKTLGALDPDNAKLYQINANEALLGLQKLDAEMNEIISPVRAKDFMVYHGAYAYFSWHYGLQSKGTLASNEGVAPSAADVKSARETIEHDNVRCFFTEPQYSSAVVATVTEGFDVNVESLDPLGRTLELGPSLYNELLLNMAQSFRRCLS